MTELLIAAVVLQVAIIFGALWFAHVEIAKQHPRNSRRHFGGV